MSLAPLHLYSKEGCHLCDDLLAKLTPQLAELQATLEIRDIEDNDYWYDRYWQYVPVLVLNAKEVCYYFLDQQELEKALNEYHQQSE